MQIFQNIDATIDRLRDELIQTLAEFVKIPSVKSAPEEGAPFGPQIREALNYFLKQCELTGLKTQDGQGYFGYADFGSGDQMLGIFGHLDVVPSGNNWSVDPFGGTIQDGKMISRGTMDDKGALVSALFALKALSQVGITPQKTIRLFFGCDEESGFSCIESYKKTEKIPDISVVVDGNFPVTYYEKGIFRFSLRYTLSENEKNNIEIVSLTGGEKLNIVAGEAKAVVRIPDHQYDIWMQTLLDNKNVNLKISKNEDETYTILAQGKKAHSSVAEKGISAISLLLSFLATLPVNGVDFFEFFAHHVGMSVHGEGLGIQAYDDESGHLTVNPGKLLMDNHSILLQFDVRYPVSTDKTLMETTLRNCIQGTSIELCEVEDSEPMRTNPESFLVSTLMKTYEDYTQVNVKPASMGGNTYAHVLPQAAAFGPNHPGKLKLAHMADESVPLDDLITNTKIYARAIYALGC